ncbi:MAG: hypothetical protein Q8908_00260 [Bacteroidota bacterium]|nr:hypothetical protein [Bacteroidota bacterium]
MLNLKRGLTPFSPISKTMVAFYLQNSKKILISSLLLLALSSFYCCRLLNPVDYSQENADSIKKINRYLDLQVTFPSDTVQMGEKISIKILFKNRTDSTVQFFPIAPLSFYRPSGAGCIIFTINTTFNLTKSIELKPRDIYSYTQNIIIDKSFFIPGENEFEVLYTFNKKQRNNLAYNVLYGYLASNKIKLIVKPWCRKI